MVYLRDLVALAALAYMPVNALELDTNSIDSVRTASKSLAKGLTGYYVGNQTGQAPGTLSSPYYWWLGGALFDSLAQYYDLTRDDQYNAILLQALDHQKAENNFLPANQTKSEGNDDQAVWALAGLSATEARVAPGNTYVTVAENVFNQQVLRWDGKSCGGGLRWQIFAFNSGYEYKNTAANGYFFELAARLARNTGNTTYSQWATKAFDWSQQIGLLDKAWNVYDGAMVGDDCGQINKVQRTASAGAYLSGAASMYNATGGDAIWKSKVDGLLNRTLEVFFPDGIAIERSCETANKCTIDSRAYKGVLARQLIDTIKAAPYTATTIRPFLTSTAKGAAAACNPAGSQCSLKWNATLSSSFGLGEQLGALGFVQSLLLWDSSRSGSAVAGNATTSVTATAGNQANPTASRTATSSPASGASSFSTGHTGVTFAGVLALIMFVAM